VFAGVVSDYLGGRALTCLMMLLFAAPSVSLHGIVALIVIELLKSLEHGQIAMFYYLAEYA